MLELVRLMVEIELVQLVEENVQGLDLLERYRAGNRQGEGASAGEGVGRLCGGGAVGGGEEGDWEGEKVGENIVALCERETGVGWGWQQRVSWQLREKIEGPGSLQTPRTVGILGEEITIYKTRL